MKSFIFAVLFFVSTSAFAVKHDIQSMSEILGYVNDETLVVFDIDNTLAEGSETIGSVQWQENEIEVAMSEGIPQRMAALRSIQRFMAVNFRSQLRPVETKTPEIVSMLQEYGVKLMALTARPADLHSRTKYLLNNIGIHLEKGQPLRDFASIYGEEQAVYSDGILAGGATNDKGTLLKWIISQPGFTKFSRIVFVDDKQKYVDSIEKTLENAPFEHHSFRYHAADARVAAFDKNLARIQTEYFLKYGEILSDEKAKQSLK